MTEPLTPPDCDLTGRAIVFSHTPRLIPEKAVFRPALALCPLPGSNGTSMTTLTFREQYQHPKWQQRRLEILQLAGWRCQVCKDNDTTLHVHHKHYFSGRMVWEYSDDELTALCEPCHQEQHAYLAGLKQELALIEHAKLPLIHALLIGLRQGIVPDGDFIPEEWRNATFFDVADVERYWSIGRTVLALEALTHDEIRELSTFAEYVKDFTLISAANLAWANRATGKAQDA